MEWATELELSSSFTELCQNAKIVAKLMSDLAATGKNLQKTEMPTKIYVDGAFEAGWLPDSGLVTDAFKLKRRQLNDHYKDVINNMKK